MKYGRWEVIEDPGGPKWLCRCECGTERMVLKKSLKYNKSKSCGCLRSELQSERNRGNTYGFRHGHSPKSKPSPTYNSWDCMHDRCRNTTHRMFHLYGGRGISVDPRWDDFANFLKDMGERPEGKTLDRFPNKDGNYEPGNCRWATPKEQAANRRKS